MRDCRRTTVSTPRAASTPMSTMYRSSLKKVAVSLVRVSPTQYLDFLDATFASAPLAQLAHSPWRETDAALTLVFFFGEGCNVNLPSNPQRGVFSLPLSLRAFFGPVAGIVM